MNIGIDIRTLMDKHYSGVSIYTLNLVQEILKQDDRNQYKLFYNSAKKVNERLPEFNLNNITIHRTAYPNKILNYLLFSFINRPYVDRQLGVDIFFMPHINFVSLSKSAKNIVTVHDLSFLHYPYFFTKRQNFWHRALKIKKLLLNATYIIAVSENTKRDIMYFYGIAENKIKVIYSGIDKSFKPIDRSDDRFLKIQHKYKLPEKFILYLGNIEPRKNIESILEAYFLLRNKNTHSELKLVIAGNLAWKHNIIKTMVKNSAYENDVYFLGYIDQEEKPYLYNLASLFIFPSFYEGFGFPPLEAAACGTPVICSNRASLPEIMNESAILINPHNITEIKEAMLQILTDQDLRKEMSLRGVEHAKQYTWKKCAHEIIDLFHEVSRQS